MRQGRIQKVAVACCDGDAPGMNPFLRVFVRLAQNRYQTCVLGIKGGLLGLVRTWERINALATQEPDVLEDIQNRPGNDGLRYFWQDVVQMDHHSVSGVIDRGGILLGSSRSDEFVRHRDRDHALQLLCHFLGVDAIVVVGGADSRPAAEMLAAETGLVVINVPATIDNDHPLTERSLGFDTAVNTIVECVRRLNDTAAALRRIIVIETMGRDSGQLAQMAALASGAEIVVTPHAGPLTVEKMESIARRIQGSLQRGRTHAIVLVTEGVRTVPQNPGGPSKALADHLQRRFHEIIIGGEVCHVDVRHSVLGHLQRGGTPSTTDRLLAADFAEAAWEALMAARPRSGVLGLSRGRIVRHDFDASPLTRRDEELKRICRLQKDLTDYRSLPLLEEAAGRRPSARRRRRTASRPSAR